MGLIVDSHEDDICLILPCEVMSIKEAIMAITVPPLLQKTCESDTAEQ